ncbi:aspartate aminotransferase family protein [Candidatus Endoriftia persephonae]|uniref:Acetylornithine aminotransferase n=2 Tax=Gammaproteobacteria TaxID=1236 RepID=G2FJI8_9GAMM|nr:aspartate aminotransferase family protein [Candidatus Endoriftia persephone]EGW53048.1 acetylornithine aminotransferase [endosymbiont of Tevnia jerichonana (vent Tica)]USF87075.1 aspartate aminotransferase family protein [Candidatus Endoriftia persephone]
MADSLMATYARLPVTFERGEGAWLWDTDGRRYLDAVSGIAVCNLGHAHPAVRQALCEQAGELIHTSNLYGIQQQQRLGDLLTQLSGMQRVFFANSGAEANEAAIKIARLHGHNRGITTPQIIVAEGSFHGRTLATLSATGNRKVQAGFEPLVQGFIRVPFGDAAAIAQVAANNQDVVAVLLEPVQGEGGVNIPASDYLNQVREICDQQGWLMMLDEIQTGMGRTGKLFAHQHNGILPDVMTLAKGLGNGVPIGACLAQGVAAEVLGPGTHGSTFGGNPLACRVACCVVETMQAEAIPERAAALSERMLAAFKQQLDDLDGVVDIRAVGLLLGIELDRPCGELVSKALQQGLLINVAAERVIRLIPPLIISDAEADQIISGVSALIHDFL